MQTNPTSGTRLFSLYIFVPHKIAMQTIQTVVVVALIAVAASIAGLNVAQMVYAKQPTPPQPGGGLTSKCPCGSGNPHVPDPDTGIVPQGNPHDFESMVTNHNPHLKF